MIPPILKEYIHNRLDEHAPSGLILKTHPVSGGDINDAYRLECERRSFFVKINSAHTFPGMFEKEAKGLHLLRRHSGFKIPEVIEAGQFDNYAFLILQYLPSGKSTGAFWKNFGVLLAQMHQVSQEQFGLDHANYIGKLPQVNRWHDKWSTFFAQERILPQWWHARQNGHFSSKDEQRLEALLQNLENLVPVEPPALLHGDLWSGNYLPFAERQPALIDPAVYYGHREMDIAMMHLFGGFPRELFRAYNEEYPLEKGWQQRLDIHNLYPLLVHVNLFGGGYAGEVSRILNR
mgnify:CR=1 FL=1